MTEISNLLKRTLSIGMLLAIIVVAGCDSQSGVAPELGDETTEAMLTDEERAFLQSQGVSAGKFGLSISEAPMYTFGDEDRVGRSRMLRLDNGVLATIRTSQLEPGTATTLWMVVFNAPEHCSDGVCGSDDLRNPEARADLIWVDGQVIGPSGRARYFLWRRTGALHGSINEPLLGKPALGMEEAHDAEIHYVVRTHGPVIDGFEYEMTHTFNGCCQLGSLPDDPRLGPVGPNTCKNLQFAIHLP